MTMGLIEGGNRIFVVPYNIFIPNSLLDYTSQYATHSPCFKKKKHILQLMYHVSRTFQYSRISNCYLDIIVCREIGKIE